MNKKTLGVLTPILVIIGSIITSFIVGIIVGSQSNDGWAALGALIFVFLLTGLVLIILLITGAVLYSKTKSDYWLGLLYGLGGVAGTGVLLIIFTQLYNFLVS